MVLILGCASSLKIGETKLVETSNNKEDWVKEDKDFYIKEGIMYFRSMITNRKDLAFAKREAKAEAVKNIAEEINIRVRGEFDQAAKGTNVDEKGLSQFSSDAVSWITENLNIQGLSPSNSYWEKYKKRINLGYDYYYDVYVLVRMSEGDYYENRKRAIEELAKRYREQNNKAAQDVLEQLKDRLLKEQQ